MIILKDCGVEKNCEAGEGVNNPYFKRLAKYVFLN
jgi:hypothetical protein